MAEVTSASTWVLCFSFFSLCVFALCICFSMLWSTDSQPSHLQKERKPFVAQPTTIITKLSSISTNCSRRSRVPVVSPTDFGDKWRKQDFGQNDLQPDRDRWNLISAPARMRNPDKSVVFTPTAGHCSVYRVATRQDIKLADIFTDFKLTTNEFSLIIQVKSSGNEASNKATETYSFLRNFLKLHCFQKLLPKPNGHPKVKLPGFHKV